MAVILKIKQKSFFHSLVFQAIATKFGNAQVDAELNPIGT